MTELTELHKVDNNYIVTEAVSLLRKAAKAIEERAKCYNSNDINFHDFMIMGVDSAVAMTVESVVRAWNGSHEDKCMDAVAYQALTMALLKAGVPQSRFSPIFRRFMPELYKAMKRVDCGADNISIVDTGSKLPEFVEISGIRYKIIKEDCAISREEALAG